MISRLTKADVLANQDLGKVTCLLCSRLFQDPVFAEGACRCVFCKECYVGHLKEKPECPMCGARNQKKVVKEHRETIKLLDKVQVICSKDCSWTGPYELRMAHQLTCPVVELQEEIERVTNTLEAEHEKLCGLRDEYRRLYEDKCRLDQQRAELEKVEDVEIEASSSHSSVKLVDQSDEVLCVKIALAAGRIETWLPLSRSSDAGELKRPREQKMEEDMAMIRGCKKVLNARSKLYFGKSYALSDPQSYLVQKIQRDAHAGIIGDVAREVLSIVRAYGQELQTLPQKDASGRNVAGLEIMPNYDQLRSARADVENFCLRKTKSIIKEGRMHRYLLLPKADKKQNNKALLQAATEGKLNTIRQLISQVLCDVDARDMAGHTALHKAAAEGHVQIIQYLITKGFANVNYHMADGPTVLSMAANNRIREILRRAGSQ